MEAGMKTYQPGYVVLVSFVILLAGGVLAATGDAVKQFPAPASCPTGLTFDGTYLWSADRKTDSLYKIDPADGSVVASFQAPGYQIEGLTAEAECLWVLNVEDGVALRWNTRNEIAEKTIYIPCRRPQGLAWDGKYLWVADYGEDRLFQISTEDGTTIYDIPSPSKNPYGLTFDGKYLWVSDRYDDMIYMVHPESGNVILAFDSPSKFPRGLAYDGEYLWNVDYQTDSLYQIKIHDTTTYVRTEGKKEEMEFTHQFRNYGPGQITSLDIYMALPRDLPFQTLLDTLEFYPQPTDFLTDRWGQKVAHYHLDDLSSGEFVTVRMIARAELFKARFYIFPDEVGTLSDIPKEISSLYLGDDTKYWVDDPFIRSTAGNVVGDEKNCYWIARKLFNHVIENIEYELVGGWNVAPTVLKRGTGSCSEYSFVYIALCRAAGLPARYAGSVVIRGDDASSDEVFHRWVEVYLPNYGWIPIDPSGGDYDYPAQQASAIGHLSNRFLITTIGGGGSEYLEWTYNSNEIWQSAGPCKVYSEHIGEWSPIVEE
jgi:transglutaminase-like putative cysteine protease/glutamine cyclotransferase